MEEYKDEFGRALTVLKPILQYGHNSLADVREVNPDLTSIAKFQ